MYAAIIKEFHTNDYGVAWLGAIFQLCKGIFTIPGGFALHRFGCRTCFRAGAVLILCLEQNVLMDLTLGNEEMKSP